MGIIDFVFPKRCVGCRKEGGYICKICQNNLWKPEPICPVCTRFSRGGWSHSRCQRNGEMDRLLVGLPYRGVVQKSLKKIKYQSQWDMIKILFDLWEEKMNLEFCKQKSELPENIIVTSVPMWRGKENERGFNQAEIIAKLLAKYLQGQTLQAIAMLERKRETKPMFGLNKQERRKNVEGAFAINPKFEILNSRLVVLVDDVWTTGATMKECERVLKKGGADSVWGVALAR